MTSRTRLTGRTLAAAVALGVALAVAGCGSASTGSSGTGSSSGSQDSSSGTSSGSTADKPLTKDDIMRVTYAAAVKAGTGHMTMDVSGSGKLSAKGDVDYGNGQPTMSMTMSMPQLSKGPMELRYVGKVLFLQMPGLTPAGKFVAIDPTDKNSQLAKAFSATADQMDPLKSIKAMEAAVQSVDLVGQEKVDGASTDHYKLTVATADLVKGLSPQAAQQANLPKTITYDMWLDQKHLLRRMSFDLAGTKFVSTMTQWGEPVHIERPKPSQIVKMPGA
jgi:hypothetical protein